MLSRLLVLLMRSAFFTCHYGVEQNGYFNCWLYECVYYTRTYEYMYVCKCAYTRDMCLSFICCMPIRRVLLFIFLFFGVHYHCFCFCYCCCSGLVNYCTAAVSAVRSCSEISEIGLASVIKFNAKKSRSMGAPLMYWHIYIHIHIYTYVCADHCVVTRRSSVGKIVIKICTSSAETDELKKKYYTYICMYCVWSILLVFVLYFTTIIFSFMEIYICTISMCLCIYKNNEQSASS